MNILIAGCGRLGSQVGSSLAIDKNTQVFGIKRQYTPLPFNQINKNLKEITPNDLPKQIDIILYCITPDKRDETHYREAFIANQEALKQSIQQKNQPFYLFVSSTAVYSQDNGEWVDEKSPKIPTNFNGKILIEAEKWVTANYKRHLIIYPSGIYQNKSERYIKRLKENDLFTDKWTNRIHIKDLSKSVTLLIKHVQQNKALENHYIITDDQPATEFEVATFIAKEYNLTLPKKIATNHLSKRLSNHKIKKLGFKPAFPNYQFGYKK